MLSKLAALFAWKHTLNTGFSARDAKIVHMKIVPNLLMEVIVSVTRAVV
jgi:hypothetical protein